MKPTHSTFRDPFEPIVITGIGMITSVGDDRETVWRAVRAGKSGVRWLRGMLTIPDHSLIGAVVDLLPDRPRLMRVIGLSHHAAAEAMHDSGVVLQNVDLDRFGCAISGHMGDTGFIERRHGLDDKDWTNGVPWWTQFLPNTACSSVANHYHLGGPRLCHSTACASGLIDILSAVRSIQDGQCDIALAGSAEAIHPLFAAGFRRMRVLARHDDPTQACRPFDRDRNGFVMGEGAAMMVVERLSHARARGAVIYAEIVGGQMRAEAHHVTSLDAGSDAIAHVITSALRTARIAPHEIDYVNAHGTGTQINDPVEIRGIRKALGPAAEQVCVSSTKSMLGHLVNASGSVELAISALALRDCFAPPTVNLTNQDPSCNLDCLPLRGRSETLNHVLKLSIAFGGHLVAAILRRWTDSDSRADHDDHDVSIAA